MVNLNKIPEWQYPLYKQSDKVAYLSLSKSKSHPGLIGSKDEIGHFLKLLLLSQKMKDYRKFRDIALNEFNKTTANIPQILNKSKNFKIIKGVDKSWAIFKQDQRICELMDKFSDAKIQFTGTNKETAEFFKRFLLSQLLQDWRGPLIATIGECLLNKKVKLSKLNQLLKIWDYTRIFT